MDTSRRASGYDLFKLIVAILLLALFLLLLRRSGISSFAGATTSTSFAISATSATNPAAVLATSTLVSRSTPTETIEAVPASSISSTTTTDVNTRSVTLAPSPTATEPVASTATPLPTPTETAVLEAAPTPGTEAPSARTACEAATARSRLQTGTSATILHRLNFRSSPGIQNNWLRTNLPGTNIEVIGGPECLPHLAGAYIWWQIRLPDGETGWSAEGSIHGTFYFMEPIQ